MPSDATAEDIADDLLFRTGRAFDFDDPVDVSDCFILPQYVETQLGSRLIESEEEVRNSFASVRKYYLDNDVADVVRTVVSAEFLDPDTIGSTHVSRLLRPGGVLFRAPFPTYSIIRRTKKGWKIASCSYAILDAPDHNRALYPDLTKD